MDCEGVCFGPDENWNEGDTKSGEPIYEPLYLSVRMLRINQIIGAKGKCNALVFIFLSMVWACSGSKGVQNDEGPAESGTSRAEQKGEADSSDRWGRFTEKRGSTLITSNPIGLKDSSNSTEERDPKSTFLLKGAMYRIDLKDLNQIKHGTPEYMRDDTIFKGNRLKVMCNGEVDSILRVSGTYHIELPVRRKYVVEVMNDNYLNKRIYIDASGLEKYYGEKYVIQADISLHPDNEKIENTEGMFGGFYFSDSKDNFVPDTTMFKKSIERLQGKVRD